MIDTHCHLNHEQFYDELDNVVGRAHSAGVDRMIVIGFDLASSEWAVRIAREKEGVFAVVGVHPHDAKTWSDSAAAYVRELAADEKVVAIGEIGLDYHYDFSPRDQQAAAFEDQLAIASDVGLPVVIHCREAYPDTLDILGSKLDRRCGGVMHCWAGDPEEAERSIGLGMHLGFGGVLTFKNADENRAIAAAVPGDRILIETDAPYLAPVPYRGKRNEPAYVRIVAEKLAQLRGVEVDEIDRITTENACRLFGL